MHNSILMKVMMYMDRTIMLLVCVVLDPQASLHVCTKGMMLQPGYSSVTTTIMLHTVVMLISWKVSALPYSDDEVHINNKSLTLIVNLATLYQCYAKLEPNCIILFEPFVKNAIIRSHQNNLPTRSGLLIQSLKNKTLK